VSAPLRSRSSRARSLRSLCVVLAAAMAVGVLTPAFADDPDVLRAELAEQERRAAELAERTAAVESELAGTRQELASLQQRLEEVSARLLEAQAREERRTEDAELARGQAEHALRELDASEGALTENADQLAALARDTYKYGAPRSSVVSLMGSVTTGEGPSGLVDAVHYLNRGLGQWSVLVDESSALVVRVDAAATRAEEERRRREALLEEAAQARDAAAEAHAEAADLVSQVSLQELRQEQLIAELAEARADAQQRIGDLETRIEAEERRRAEEEARRRAEAEARRRAEAEARRQREAEAQRQREAEERRKQEAEQRRQAASQPARTSAPAAPRPAAPRPAPGPSTNIVSVGSGLVTVGGITVASSLGPNLQALLDAARADGIVLGGHGWRSMEAQARLRIANGCRDVYTAPASSCRVPTAIPGSSEHEKGLAIDFTWQGRTICYPLSSRSCSGNAAFDWLKANAGKYGLRNLPSEAWHWSTTGR
jgi:zinc D-Ala-D-Ala carboxypeptidase